MQINSHAGMYVKLRNCTMYGYCYNKDTDDNDNTGLNKNENKHTYMEVKFMIK